MKTQARRKQTRAPIRPGKQPGRNVNAHVFRKASILALACCLMLGTPLYVRSQSDETAGYPLKLAFLYRIAQFTDWPPDAFRDANAPVVMCVAGEDPFNPDLENELRHRTINSHPVEITRVKIGGNFKECHVVFIPAAAGKQTQSIVRSLKSSGILTVGESKGFVECGGIVNFIIQKNKLTFEINLNAAQEGPLRLSSKILALAMIVRDPAPPGAGVKSRKSAE